MFEGDLYIKYFILCWNGNFCMNEKVFKSFCVSNLLMVMARVRNGTDDNNWMMLQSFRAGIICRQQTVNSQSNDLLLEQIQLLCFSLQRDRCNVNSARIYSTLNIEWHSECRFELSPMNGTSHRSFVLAQQITNDSQKKSVWK